MLEKQLKIFSNSGGNFFNLQIGLMGHPNMGLAVFGSSRSLAKWTQNAGRNFSYVIGYLIN